MMWISDSICFFTPRRVSTGGEAEAHGYGVTLVIANFVFGARLLGRRNRLGELNVYLGFNVFRKVYPLGLLSLASAAGRPHC